MAEALDPRFFDTTARRYDALLIVSFGGPEGPDEVMPFLDNVFRGLRVSAETRARIAARYEEFGGISPINEHTRAFIAALKQLLDHEGPALPIYWGNRNWHPLLPDTLAQMAHDGVGRAAAFVTSTFSSYSGCRRYREDLAAAVVGLDKAPVIDKLRIGFNHPGFVTAVADRLVEAITRVPPRRRRKGALIFTAHSLPEAMAAGSDYVAQLEEAARLAAGAAGIDSWKLVYQSNNARYGGEPWLGPDIGDALDEAAGAGIKDVVVMPLGFVCDHMEVVLDLDVDAKRRARDAGVNMIRAGTVGTHPAYVAMVRDLLVERMAGGESRKTLGTMPPMHDFCPADCCLPGRPGPLAPALAGAAASRGTRA
jgi:ferrochelatase